MRSVLVALVAAIVSFNALAAEESPGYPARPVRIVVPFPPGGITDVYARLMGQKLQASLKQPFVVENRGGATAMIGTASVAQAPADGYTLLFTANTHVIAAVAHKKPPYDPVKDFTPVAPTVIYPFYMVGTHKLPAATVQELIAYGRANPGKLNFGTLGEGSGGHLLGQTFSQLTGIKAVHVPYKGTGAILQALQAGEVHYAFDSIASAQGLVDGGKLRGYAITADSRFAAAPNVATMAEAGVKDFEAWLWLGLLAPANTPAGVVATLNAGINQALRSPEIAERIEKSALRAAIETPEQFAQRIQQDVTIWTSAVQRAGVALE